MTMTPETKTASSVIVRSPRRIRATDVRGLQSLRVNRSRSTGGDFNHALASGGSAATASGSTGSSGPGNAIAGVSSTYWPSSPTTGWLAVQFQTLAYNNVVKAHFTPTK